LGSGWGSPRCSFNSVPTVRCASLFDSESARIGHHLWTPRNGRRGNSAAGPSAGTEFAAPDNLYDHGQRGAVPSRNALSSLRGFCRRASFRPVGCCQGDVEVKIELRSVSKSYAAKAALSPVSATFNEGKHVAIIGPSGCGKSTMLRLLAGLEAPSTGTIFKDDVVFSKAEEIVVAPHQRGIGMVFQDLALWPNLSVLKNVVLGLSGRALSKADIRKIGLDSLALCGIRDLIDRKPGQLSGGEQQRVALARALTVRPRFLLLDEPFSSLDLATKSVLLADLRSLLAEQKITILLVTHDPADAVTLCSSLIVMERGAITEVGTLEDLVRIPTKSPSLDAFVRRCQLLQSISPQDDGLRRKDLV
jgi:ABC-type Fe3+/spermidine/putrescine transport system ATPase subunit